MTQSRIAIEGSLGHVGLLEETGKAARVDGLGNQNSVLYDTKRHSEPTQDRIFFQQGP